MNFAGPFDSKLLNDSPVSLDGDAFAFGAKPGYVQHHPSEGHVVVPDAHLLFSGSYVRIGNDLIISGSDQKFVVGNYFKGEARPTLSSKDGATLSGQIVDALTGHVVYAQAAAPAAAAAQVIGHVLKLSGSASVLRNGVSVELHIGDAVQKGDVVQTGSDSSVGLTFIDGSAFGMTSNARMVLNEMIYDPNGSSNSSLISLVQGTITFVAGQTAKNGNMRVETPVATMGIRGTAVLVEISANDGPTKFSVLVEPDGHTGSFNLYDKTTGQLIGTVSQAGQVTFVSSLGVGQTPTAVEQLKTLADQQSEKFIIQQVFQLYFPNYTPDDAKPNSPKSNPRTDIGVPENNIGKYAFDPVTGRLTYTVTTPITNPDTHQTTDTKIVFYNIKAAFTATALSAKEESPGDPSTSGLVKLKDAVHIDDPDINVGPFFDVATPFVAHSGALTSATTTATLTPAAKAALHLDTLLTIDQITGDVSFNRADFNFLAAGEKAEYVIRVTASSGPDSANVFIKVTITGENDAPTIETASTVDTGGVTEDYVPVTDNLETSGSIGFQDFDLTDGHTASFALKSAVSSTHLPGFVDGAVGTVSGVIGLGSFSLDAVGEILTDATNTGQVGWHFVLPDNDPVLQSLAAGQTIKQVYTVTITDGSGVSVTRDVEVTITGTNDAPVLTADASIHQADEVPDTTGAPNSVVDVATGTLAFVDVDLSDTHTASAALHPGATSVVWSGGYYSGIPQATRDALNTAMTAAVSENNTDPHNYGSVGWEFKLPDHLFDFLAHGETLTLIYDVTITDNNGLSSTKQVTVQIGASNDQPVISVVEDAAVKEDVGAVYDILKDTGSVTFTDTDLTDTHKAYVAYNNDAAGSAGVPLLLANALATALTVPASALAAGNHTFNWNFALDTNLVQYLAEGETITATYTITVEDNSNGTNDTSAGQVVTVVITGTNDAPTITVTNPAAVAEGDTGTSAPVVITVAAQVAVTDVDASDVKTPYAGALSFDAVNSSGPAPAVGSLSDLFTVNVTNGKISYDRAAFDYLAGGEHVTAVFTFNVSSGPDTVQKSITVTIDGVNDAPVITAVDVAGLVKEDASVVAVNLLHDTGSVTFADVDATDHETANVGFVSDVASSGVTVSNDLHTALQNALTLQTSSFASNTGVVNWDFNLDNSLVQYLAEGETITVSYTITVNDDSGVAATDTSAQQTVTVVITGTADAPTVVAGSTIATGTISKITNTTGSSATDSASGTIAFADPDSTDTHTATAGSPTFTWSGGTLTATQIAALAAADSFVPSVSEIGGSGSVAWTYNITDSALDFMLPWQTLTVQYDVTVADNDGLSFVRPVTVTVSASYQSSYTPVGHDDSATVSANAPAIIPVLNNDTGNGLYIYETLAYPYSSFVVTNHSSNGATLTSLGNAVFYDPTTSSLFNSLAYGQTATDHFAYGITDSNNVSWANVTVTVTGADHSSLSTTADTISNAHTTVVSADATTLNPLDSLTGSGSDTLLLNGSGTFDLADVAHFSGFKDIVVQGSNANLEIDSSDTVGVSYIIGSGSSLTLTTAAASLDLSHTAVSGFSITGTNADGTTFIVGDSATASAITGGTGPLTIQAATDTNNGFTFTAPVAGATLIGGNGNDTLISAQTNVTMTGGAGADNFKFNANFGNDTIMDFVTGTDKIDFQALTSIDATALTALLNTADQIGGDMLLHLNGNTDTLLVKGVASLNTSDFILHA